jgi:hypothetical protein
LLKICHSAPALSFWHFLLLYHVIILTSSHALFTSPSASHISAPTASSQATVFEITTKFDLTFKFNQQAATLYNILYCRQCSTCFGRFFHPSSGAQTVHTATGMSGLFAATASVGELALPTHPR